MADGIAAGALKGTTTPLLCVWDFGIVRSDLEATEARDCNDLTRCDIGTNPDP
jgi:hypothetical protein